ncbi:MAG: hypothetical protein KatS3mg057_1374 [Herpetosiphonaceae bacterium]|nr:MAG: hypothetical protein KatS3mg057_1374 [Herpetosiphonaceae bacterium]
MTLSRVSAALAHDLGRSQFIALVYAVFDPRSGRLRLANAGQLEPILVRGRQIRYLATPGERLPLGLGVERRYDELMIDLQPGDRVLFYTDGVLEAQNVSGELFGFERLEALLRRLNPGADAIERLRRDLSRFTNGIGPADDVTVVELAMTVPDR